MKITSIKTHKITVKDRLFSVLDAYVKKAPEKSILAITSKIVALCEGRAVMAEKTSKDKLVQQEAERYVPRKHNKYGFCITITKNKLIASAGIDESNGNGYYVLWPANPQKTANSIRKYLVRRFRRKYIGVIITDSHTIPMIRGVVGMCLAHSGFLATKNYIGTPDVFGRNLHVTHQNHTEGLAAAADVVMGGANEQTPLALIEDVSFIHFQDRNPTKKELSMININLKDDIFWPLFNRKLWKKCS